MSSQRGTVQVTNGRGKRRGRSTEGADGLPPCPQGMRCPYRGEYQHNLEFSHSYLATPSSSSSAEPFTGAGHRLGGFDDLPPGVFEDYGPGVFSPQPDRKKRPRAPRTATASYPLDDRFDVEQLAFLGGLPTHDVPGGSPLSFVTCGICSERVGLDGLDRHMALHDKQKESRQLQRNQDQEYADSVLKEVLRTSEELEQQRQAALAKQQEEASAVLKQAMEMSLQQRQIEARDKARATLLPEPGADCSDPVITLRFILPSGHRLMRRFRANRSMQDCFSFLRTLDELCHENFFLKETVGTNIFRPSSPTIGTFLAEGLRANTSLVVVIDDEPQQASANEPVEVASPPILILEPDERAAPGPSLPIKVEVVDLT